MNQLLVQDFIVFPEMAQRAETSFSPKLAVSPPYHLFNAYAQA